mmetsp:Transcript_38910/g.82861  ORF Transcript_38910/g.82861 Transcript_38910/m.82861 type:complete len:273 (+) Transcript_38910:74-892(+)
MSDNGSPRGSGGTTRTATLPECSDASPVRIQVHPLAQLSKEAAGVASGESSSSGDADFAQLTFEDTDTFYAEVRRLCNEGAPFLLRLPCFESLAELPERLREFLQAAEGCAGRALWAEAFRSLEEDGEDGNERLRFRIRLEREFDDSDVADSWYDGLLEIADADKGGSASQIAPLPMALLPGTLGRGCLRATLWAYYASRYGWAWSRVQERRRWYWIAGLAVAGAGVSAATMGAGAPLVAGIAAGTTAGIISTGKRWAEITVSSNGTVVRCR